MKQFIVINAETASKCWVWSGESPGAPPSFSSLCSLSPSPPSSSLSLERKSLGGASFWEGLYSTVLDQFSTGLFWQRKIFYLTSFRRFCRVFTFSKADGGGTNPCHHCYSCHNHFNFGTWKWQVTHPSPSSYGPCGVVIAFLDDFLFKSAVLLIFQMK